MALAQGITYLCEKPQRLLDAGCGHGMRAVEMQMKYFPQSVVIGCDYSEPMIANATLIMQNLPPDKRVRCEEANVYNLPYGDDTFDVVYCYGLLMSLEEIELGLNELMRVSVNGLVAIEETPDVMDSIQFRYWSDYKEKRFPGRTFWHSYLKAFSKYGTTIFDRLSTEVWAPDEGSPENHRVAPAYARFIVTKS